jgi:hypothetical protein
MECREVEERGLTKDDPACSPVASSGFHRWSAAEVHSSVAHYHNVIHNVVHLHHIEGVLFATGVDGTAIADVV